MNDGGSNKVYSLPPIAILMEAEQKANLRIFGMGEYLPPSYFHTRFTVLRQPLNYASGSEKLADDDKAIHAGIEIDNDFVAVGRIHKIDSNCDGGQADHAGPDAPLCPGFAPLGKENNAITANMELRPACQIRQMGTLNKWQRRGFAARILRALEDAAQEKWSCNSGWLQARIDAVPFYTNAGWKCFGEEYDIVGIGPHMSMFKLF
ncbi:MAG TPA: GNAT family N-acetyltransferase [Candidatus Poseidoniales archaeon]|jgi:GNAT superfamily N-acetyltransferase|nr:MAG: hypothetical protein CXT67_01035 [Euryarchaeota archaeon]HIG03651.1 GNAT family N-acetyltransferase [Candidatus Poseidoniales archaeon]HIK78971.1 GNAT family N-acetyltransferase [Candidatus Poseidoniales archaeon]